MVIPITSKILDIFPQHVLKNLNSSFRLTIDLRMECCTQFDFYPKCLLIGLLEVRSELSLLVWDDRYYTTCKYTIFFMYNWESCTTIYVILIGGKYVDLVSLSTTTQTKSCFCKNPITKTILMHSNFHFGITMFCASPHGFWCSTLTSCQFKHLTINFTSCFFIFFHQ